MGLFPNGFGLEIGPDWPSVYIGPFWNRSRLGPKLDLLILDEFQMVPFKRKGNPDQFRMVPIQFGANVASVFRPSPHKILGPDLHPNTASDNSGVDTNCSFLFFILFWINQLSKKCPFYYCLSSYFLDFTPILSYHHYVIACGMPTRIVLHLEYTTK